MNGFCKQWSTGLCTLQIWSDKTNLTFSKASKGEKVDVDIFFAKGEHGDGSAFDGPRGVLAHATFPRYGTLLFFRCRIQPDIYLSNVL